MNKRKKGKRVACFKHENSVPSPFFLPPPEGRGEKEWTGRGRVKKLFDRVLTENKHDNCTEFSNSKAHGQKDGQNTVRKHDENGDLAELRKAIEEKSNALEA